MSGRVVSRPAALPLCIDAKLLIFASANVRDGEESGPSAYGDANGDSRHSGAPPFPKTIEKPESMSLARGVTTARF